MSFMRIFTTQEDFVTFDDREGGHAIPLDVLGFAHAGATDPKIKQAIKRSYSLGDVSSVKVIRGKWWARYSAPGYLDCTEWVGPAETEAQAVEECRELYGDGEEET